MAKIGYARVSSQSQSLAIQLDVLEKAGCQPVRSEKASAKSRDDRPELASVLSFIRDGDELVVTKLDRLGRSTRDVLNIVHELDTKGASLRVLEPELTTSGEVGRIVVVVLGMVAELERKFIKERQSAGIEAAKKAGVYKGSRKRIDGARIASLRSDGLTPTQIANTLKIARMTVYRELKKLENSKHDVS